MQSYVQVQIGKDLARNLGHGNLLAHVSRFQEMQMTIPQSSSCNQGTSEVCHINACQTAGNTMPCELTGSLLHPATSSHQDLPAEPWLWGACTGESAQAPALHGPA